MAAEVNPILDTLDNNTKIFKSDCDKIKESFQDLRGAFQRPMQMNIFQHLPNEGKQFQRRKMRKFIEEIKKQELFHYIKSKKKKEETFGHLFERHTSLYRPGFQHHGTFSRK